MSFESVVKVDTVVESAVGKSAVVVVMEQMVLVEPVVQDYLTSLPTNHCSSSSYLSNMSDDTASIEIIPKLEAIDIAPIKLDRDIAL